VKRQRTSGADRGLGMLTANTLGHMGTLRAYAYTGVLPGVALAAVLAIGAHVRLAQSAIPAIAAFVAAAYLVWVKTRLDGQLKQFKSSDDFVIVGDEVRLKKHDDLIVELGSATVLSLERWVVIFPIVASVAPALGAILGGDRSVSGRLIVAAVLLVGWAARAISHEEERVLRIAEAHQRGLQSLARLSEGLTAPDEDKKP
jgi:hypothetical protein